MALINALKNNVNEKFINAKVEGTGKLAPRPGYFFIRSLSYETVQPFGEICIAAVNWKQNLDDLFVEDFIARIALSNMASAKPEQTKHLDLPDLVGKIVRIFNPSFISKNFNGVEKIVLNCMWEFVDQEPQFINKNNASLLSLSKGKPLDQIPFADAVKNFAANAPYDVTTAEEDELNRTDTNSIIEENAHQENDYIEDIPDENDDDDDPTVLITT